MPATIETSTISLAELLDEAAEKDNELDALFQLVDRTELNLAKTDCQRRRSPKKFREPLVHFEDFKNYPNSRPHHMNTPKWGWWAVKPSHGPRRNYAKNNG